MAEDRGRRRAAAGGGRQAVQLRCVPGGRPGPGYRAQDLSAHHQRILRGALVYFRAAWRPADTVEFAGNEVPFGRDLLFAADNLPGCVSGIEICEDLWAVNPPSGDMALAGATILLNPSASNELLGKVDYRRDLVRQQSARCLAAYLYAGAGAGRIDHRHGLGRTFADRRERRASWPRPSAFGSTRRWRWPTSTCSGWCTSGCATTPIGFGRPAARFRDDALPSARRGTVVGRRAVDPAAALAHAVCARRPDRRAEHCREIFNIQSTGLAKRLRHTGDAACDHRRLGRAGFDAGAAGDGQGV